MKEQLGERLTELREDLSKRTGEKWPMGKVAQATGITQNMIERIEGGKGGTMETYLALFNFYYSKGYNLNWLIIENNQVFSKYRVSEDKNSIEIERLLIKIENFKKEMDQSVDMMIMDMLVNS